MHLIQIYLNNYRNYSQEHLKFNKYLNIIVGNNAQGKTNLLEAIYLLGTGISHRSNVNSELVNWDSNKFMLKGEAQINKQNYKIELKLKGRSKKAFINSNKLKKISELMEYLNVVIFAPEDLKLVKGSPSCRRDFINLEISQISSYYRNLLKEYKKVLKQRNNLLKEIREKRTASTNLEIWNQQLVKFGSKIIKKRLEALKKLSILAKLMQRKITDGQETLTLNYDTKLKIGHNSNLSEIKQEFKKALAKKQSKEIDRGLTIIGPHRDDISLLVNDIDIRKFGSQGQQRTTALALKMAELEFIKAEVGEYPILLLDDVFSELDQARTKHLLKIIENKIQTFITSTKLNEFKSLTTAAKVFRVKQGVVIRKENLNA